MSRKRPTRNQKVLQNLNLVRALIIAKYGPKAAHDEDLNQAGLTGLCIAVDSFEANRIIGRFSSYARTCIISELARCSLANGRRLIRPRAYHERVAIQRQVTTLTHVLGREPTTAEILETWSGSRAPTPAAVERALRPDPVVLVEAITDVDGEDREFGTYSSEADSIEIEDLLDAKRRFERLPPEDQARLTRGGHGPGLKLVAPTGLRTRC